LGGENNLKTLTNEATVIVATWVAGANVTDSSKFPFLLQVDNKLLKTVIEVSTL
jgi:hypothetical protein